MSQGDVTFFLSIIGMVGVWTVSVIAGVIWLNGKFSRLEKLIFVELDKHRREDNQRFDEQGRKIQRLELKAFGFTMNPPSLQQRSEDWSEDQST